MSNAVTPAHEAATSTVTAPLAAAPLTIDQLRGLGGHHLGHSDWHLVTQEQVNAFGAVTEDEQWIHVDTDRAAHGPFGTTIAHGYLTLGMMTKLLTQVLVVDPSATIINYGLGKVRFPAPVLVGARIRADVTCREVTEVRGGVQVLLDVTIQAEGTDRPSCVAEVLFRYYAA